MRLSYKQIEYLREVAAHSSISAACKKLHISQSSVLAAIDIAESVTGVKLFNRRKGHGIELTPYGHKFLVSAHRFIAAGDDFERSLDQFSQTKSTTIRIGCFAPFGALLIPPVLKKYTEIHGECEIVLLEGNQIELRSWLATGAVDLIVTYDIGEEFVNGVTPICKFPAHAIINADNPVTQNSSISIDELAQMPMILLDLPETRTYLLALFDFAARRPKIGLRTKSYETVRSAVSNGLGMSILNIKPLDSLEIDNIVRMPISDQLRQPTLLVVDPYEDQKPNYVREFIYTLYEYFTDIGPENLVVAMPEYRQDIIYPRPNI
ncbi:MAG: LysR family transcriptional regulator [Arenicella sp.]